MFNIKIGVLEQHNIKNPNYYYSLGHNQSYNSEMQVYDNTHIYTPTLITGKTWTLMNHGYLAAYGMREDGSVWTSGYGGYGQLGRGTNAAYNTIEEGIAAANWKDFSGGGYNLWLLKHDGTIWGIGKNDLYELGLNENSTPKTSVVQIGSDTNWATAPCGASTAVAIKNNGTMWAWGLNTSYECGLGHANEVKVPTQIGTDTDWVNVAGGGNYIAVKRNGTVWTWGRSLNYGTGQNTTTNIQVPTQLGSFVNPRVATTTQENGGLITSDGKLYTWGAGVYNGTGQNTTANAQVPTQVGSDTDWLDLIIGYHSGFAIKTNGTLWAWGFSPACGFNAEKTVPTQHGSDTDWKSFGRNGCFSLGAFITKNYH